MSATDHPLGPDEVDGLFAPFFPDPELPAALAVSGGADSMALMVLFAEWRARGGHDISRDTVLTVDHGLRAESRAEAEIVATEARAFGYRHATLVWREDKPVTGIQQAARRARYRLMGAYMHAHRVPLLLTAHTRDDQAETLIMRLARGSGLDGLAAIAPSVDLADLDRDAAREHGVISVVRPLLDVPKARLVATLSARGLAWIEDPSNQSPAYERARLRAARAGFAALGLTDAMLALSARRLQRARRALDAAADRFCDCATGAVIADATGTFVVDLARLRAEESEIALRVLERTIAAAGGSDEPVPFASLETITEALLAGETQARKWTLARAMIENDGESVTIEREPPREPLPHIALSPGEQARWDGRFRVKAEAELQAGPVEVRPLGSAALTELRRQGALATRVRAGAAALVPSFWRGQALLAVPPLGYWSTPHHRQTLDARFIGLAGPQGNGPQGNGPQGNGPEGKFALP